MGKNKHTVSYRVVPQRQFIIADAYFVPDTGYGHFNCIILPLTTISLALKVKFPGRVSVPSLDPRVGKSVVGPRTFTTV